MGVMLLGKIKVYELAKNLGKTSKEIIAIAQELGADVKTHMSSIEEEMAKKIENKVKGVKATNTKSNKEKEEVKKEKNDGPVIIRRHVIISDEEVKKREEEEKRKKQEKQRNSNVGFVERNRNKDYNIVYRNKPTKPMTVSELFGLKDKKEEKKEEPVKEKVEAVKEEAKVEVKQKEENRFCGRRKNSKSRKQIN